MAKTTVIRLKDLKNLCEPLEKVVLRLGAATVEELDPHRPGGIENDDNGVWGWKRFNDVLHRFHARVQFGNTVSEENDGDKALLQALRSEPHIIQSRIIQGESPLLVYPKSFEALMECHKRDHLLGWLGVRYQYYYESGGAKDLEFLAQVLEEMMRQYQVLAWIVTHPKAGLPWWKEDEFGNLDYAPWSSDLGDIPGHIRDLDILQYLLIIRAYARVNAERLQVLRGMLSSDKPGVARIRPTWSIFFANASADLNASVKELMFNRPLAEVLATLQLRAVSAQDAREDAKKESAA